MTTLPGSNNKGGSVGEAYRFSTYFDLQFGVLFSFCCYNKILSLKIPFISIHICFDCDAKGYNFFKH